MRWNYIFIGYLGLFVMGLLDNLRAPFYSSMIESLNISYTKASFFFSLASFAGFVGSFLSVRFIKKFGILNLFRFCFVLSILFCLGLWKTENFYLFLLSGIFYGFGAGALSAGQNIIVADGSNVENRRRALNGLHSMYALSSLLAPLIAAYFFSIFLPWKQVFLYIAAIPIISLAFLIKISLKVPKSPANEEPVQLKNMGIKILFSACVILPTLAEITISTRLPIYLEKTYHYSGQVCSFYLAGFFFCLLVGRIIPTFFNFPFKNETVLKLACVESFILILLGLYVHPIFLSFSGMSIGPIYPTGVAWINEIMGSDHHSGMAVLSSVACVSILFLHNILGLLSDNVGISMAMNFGPLCLILGFILLVLVGKQKLKAEIQK